MNGEAVLDHQVSLHDTNESTAIEHLKGKPKSFRSRFVRGDERLKLEKYVSEITYPSKELFQRRLANLDENSFLAGNLKNVPTSKNIIKQCSHEYRRSTLIDKDVYQSIQMLTENTLLAWNLSLSQVSFSILAYNL